MKFKLVAEVGDSDNVTFEFLSDDVNQVVLKFEKFLKALNYDVQDGLKIQSILDDYYDNLIGGYVDSTIDYDYTSDENLDIGDITINIDNMNSNSSESDVMSWTSKQLLKINLCPVCKIDLDTMSNEKCWDQSCPKEKNGNA